MKKPLKENCILRVKSVIEQFEHGEASKDGGDRIEFMTHGNFVRRGGCYYLTYQETPVIGFENCVITIKVAADGSRAALLRFGQANTQLLIEGGRRNLCHYETDVGSMTLGVTADGIDCALGESGGSATIRYVLDAEDATLISRNTIQISVTPLS